MHSSYKFSLKCHAKRTISLKLDLECLWNLLRERSRLWALRRYIYVKFNLNDRSKQYQRCEQSNQVKELILKEEEEERNAGSLEDP